MATTQNIITVEVRYEDDIVLARQRARHLAALLGFDQQDQTRIATATSEIVRNAFQYAGGGTVQYQIQGRRPQMFVISVRDNGPGIAELKAILDGHYTSTSGMGLGIVGARRLMDRFDIDSAPGRGTTVLIGKHLPASVAVLGPRHIAEITDKLTRSLPYDPIQELQQQNRELLHTMEELRQRQAELAEVNAELEDTNRGVVALYAELDDRADYLQRASDLKSRFLSNMSHEFRTPLNSILSLSRLLLDRVDGELTSEQEKQVTYIRRSAEDLSELVNDLLDLAKVEAGKIVVRPAPFQVSNLFSALRGMLRPLLSQKSLELTVEEPEDIPVLETDEAKVSQVLRNLLSNALKYTEQGEVRLWVRANADDTITFIVSDTGIGIAKADLERVFQEWVQIDNPMQKKHKGTGLGLPLSRRLAQLLGGNLSAESEPGKGSTFYFTLPRVYHGAAEVSYVPDVKRDLDPTRLPIMVVEDNRETLFIYEKYLKGTGYQIIPARNLKQARELVREMRPVAVVLDILLEGENSWEFLSELKADPQRRSIPVLVVTVVDNQRKAMALGADGFTIKPVERKWLLNNLKKLTEAPAERILLIDDDEVWRYLLRGMLADTRYQLLEAEGGAEGLQKARRQHPDFILLDLLMPDVDGFQVLQQLKDDADTAAIPVIVYTSKRLSDSERRKLQQHATVVLQKNTGSRDAALAELRAAISTAAAAGPARHVQAQ